MHVISFCWTFKVVVRLHLHCKTHLNLTVSKKLCPLYAILLSRFQKHGITSRLLPMRWCKISWSFFYVNFTPHKKAYGLISELVQVYLCLKIITFSGKHLKFGSPNFPHAGRLMKTIKYVQLMIVNFCPCHPKPVEKCFHPALRCHIALA